MADVIPIRSISDIAREVRHDWVRPYFAARPYLDAMADLDSVQDMYGADSASSILAYFLSNASTWRGPTAKRVKDEIRTLLALSKRR